VSRVTRVLNRIGTADSVSWPVFWLTLLTGILGNFAAVQTGAALWLRVLIIIAAQIALFIPLIVIKVLFLQKADEPHPYIVLAGFVIAVLARALTIVYLNRAFFPADSTTVADRILGNFLNVGLVLVLSAYTVSVLRERRHQIARLKALGADRERSINIVSTELTQRNDATVNRVREILEKDLNLLDRDNPSDSLAILHDTATYVVRPMSHELAKEMPEVAQVSMSTDSSSANWGQVLDLIVTGKPFRPILTAIFLSAPTVAVVATLPGTAVVMVSVPIALAALLTISNLVFRRLPLSLGAPWRLTLFALLVALSGLLIGGGIWLAFKSGSQGVALAITGAVFSSLFAIAVSLGAGITRQRDYLIAELAQSTDNLERSLIRRKQTQWLQNKSLSRALHGPVQTAVNVAAIRIDEALRSGDIDANMIDQVRADLISSLDVLGHAEGAVVTTDQCVNRIEKTWEGICEFDISISDETHEQLDRDVILRSCFIDIVTEAVSNAIRHGEANRATINATSMDRDVILDICDNGPAALTFTAPGLGSTQLDDCTVSWSLQSVGSGHRLTAVLPT
jgi:hypothetical protein